MTASPPPLLARAVIVMGVSGSGKTTVGERLAGRLGWRYVDGDTFHPAGNVAKMRAGQPLTDDDRRPWLAAIAAAIDREIARGERIVVACSALKRSYRTVLVHGRDDIRLVYLKGSRELIARRLAGRRNHFMPSQLLDSQLAALDEPAPDECAVTVAIDAAVDAVVDEIVGALAAPAAASSPAAEPDRPGRRHI